MQDCQSSLLCRVRGVLCALPLEHVAEVMRPLAVDAVAGLPSCVRGVAIVRGVPIPVLDAGSLLSGEASRPTRFVTVKTGARHVALAVDAVLGVVDLPLGAVSALPPLFHETGTEAISAIGVLDRDLLLVLRSTRLVSDAVWNAIHQNGAAA